MELVRGRCAGRTLEPHAFLALEQPPRVHLRLDGLQPAQAFRAPRELLRRYTALLPLGVGEVPGAVGGVVALQGAEGVRADMVELNAAENGARRGGGGG